MRIVLVLCEGPHDVAFLSRLLTSEGYEKYTQPLCQFPYPLNEWMTTISKSLNIQDLSIDRMYADIKSVLPSSALINEDNQHLILLYSMNGDSKEKRRKYILSTLKSWSEVPSDEKEFSLMEESSEVGNNYGLVVIFDADNKGIASRINEARTEIEAYFPPVKVISRNGEVATIDENLKIGIYIFADPVSETGTLENILLPIMRQGNEVIFDDAQDFLNNHYNESRMKPLVFKKGTGGIIQKRDKKNKYHPIKSLMGVVGQLQNSGTSNTVCIEKADYITLEKINASSICQDIVQMFKQF